MPTNINQESWLGTHELSPEPNKSKFMEKVDSYYSITMNQFLNQSLLEFTTTSYPLSPFIHILILPTSNTKFANQ